MFSCLLVVISLLALVSNSKCSQYTLTTLAGTGIPGRSGDNGPASSAKIGIVAGTWVDSMGAIFIAEYVTGVVRRIGTDGIITPVGGTGSTSLSTRGDLSRQLHCTRRGECKETPTSCIFQINTIFGSMIERVGTGRFWREQILSELQATEVPQHLLR